MNSVKLTIYMNSVKLMIYMNSVKLMIYMNFVRSMIILLVFKSFNYRFVLLFYVRTSSTHSVNPQTDKHDDNDLDICGHSAIRANTVLL